LSNLFAVSDRMVSLCLRWSYNQTERQMVLSAVHGRQEEESLAATMPLINCVLFVELTASHSAILNSLRWPRSSSFYRWTFI